MTIESPKIDILGELPAQLDARVANLLSEKRAHSLSDSSIQNLKKKIAEKITPQYKDDWAAFTYLYYSANFLKCYLSICSSAVHFKNKTLRVLDIGCGGGASTAAAISALSMLGNKISEVIAVDRSKEQLSVFKSVTEPWIKERHPHTKVGVLQCEIFEYLEKSIDTDLILLSYVTPELSHEEIKTLRSQLAARCQLTDAFVVFVESDHLHRGISIEVLGEKPYLLPYNRVAFRSPRTESLGFQICPKFTPGKQQEQIIMNYFDCWVHHSIKELPNIFDRDCVYMINNIRTLFGIESITDYWIENSREQRNVEYSYQIVDQSLDSISLQWTASFDRVDTRDRRHLRGLMLLKISNGKISYLAEAFNQDRIVSD